MGGPPGATQGKRLGESGGEIDFARDIALVCEHNPKALLGKMMVVGQHVRQLLMAHHLHRNAVRKTVMFV